MGGEQQATGDAGTSRQGVWQAETPKWGDAIGEERKRALEDRIASWDALPRAERGERNGPFDGDVLTGADVFWLAARTLAQREQGGMPIAGAEDLLCRAGEDAVLSYFLATLEVLELLHLEGAQLQDARLDRAFLGSAHLEGAFLGGAFLRGAALMGAHLQWTVLRDVNFAGADLHGAHLEGADLHGAKLDSDTNLSGVMLGRVRVWERFVPWGRPKTVALGDVRWGGVGTVDLTRVAENWDDVWRLGDERGVSWRDGGSKHRDVVRAYQQVATQLRAQGITEAADRLSHRAYVYNRRVLIRKVRLLRYAGSWFMAILAGYGYRPMRTILWYLVTIGAFAFGYYQVTHGAPLFGLHTDPSIKPMLWYETLVLSVSSFHGRGFFQPLQNPGDPIAILAAMEAVIGLLIEVSFIATFTQRFFGSR